MSTSRSLLALCLCLSLPASLTAGPSGADPASPAATERPAPGAASDEEIAGLIEALGYRTQVARGLARMGTAAAQRRVEGIEDRRTRARRLATLQALAVRFEAAFAWERILPLMVASWQAHLDHRQVLALTAFLDTAAGRLYAGKGLAAINEAAIDQAIHLDAAIDEVFDRPAGAAPARLRRIREPAPDSHAGLALRWLRLHDPEQAQVFDERKAQGLAAARAAFQSATGDGSLTPEHQRILAAYEAGIRLADLERIAVRRLVDELDRGELSSLVDAFDTPAMQSLAAARARADRASGERFAELVQQALADGLMWDLLRATID